jgi:transcription elongation factor GreA
VELFFNMQTLNFTQEGFFKVKKEYEDLLVSRKGAVEQLRTAREMGDLSENAAYKVARQKLSSIDARLRKLFLILKTAKIKKVEFKGIVDFGTKVTLITDGKELVYRIVGGFETDPSLGKLSEQSPLGRALVGKKVGETVEINAPVGKISYRILKIEPAKI